jgi:2,4-dienoyl-CoA reductase-like NADH-dependent reductase (Old Yellow Enzyme family)
MKKAALIVCIALLALGLSACKGGGGKYADVTSLMTKYMDSIDKFVAALEKSTSADGVATALNGLTAATKELAPQMKAMGEKYPEFKNMENPPAELKPLMDKVMASATKMMGAMGKAQQYMTDPKVQEAQKAYAEAAGAMR